MSEPDDDGIVADTESKSEVGKEELSDVVATSTTDVEVPDPASGTPLTYRVVDGTRVPAHLLDAYENPPLPREE